MLNSKVFMVGAATLCVLVPATGAGAVSNAADRTEVRVQVACNDRSHDGNLVDCTDAKKVEIILIQISPEAVPNPEIWVEVWKRSRNSTGPHRELVGKVGRDGVPWQQAEKPQHWTARLVISRPEGSTSVRLDVEGSDGIGFLGPDLGPNLTVPEKPITINF